jgi:catechol 2,3-dioxygenase-like lactoylglutathione lyase family enzyme
MELTAAVIFVRDLNRSGDFYQQLLEFEIEIRETDGLLLRGTDGSCIVLRALPGAHRALAALGVQHLVWTARDASDLLRCKTVLETWLGPVSTTDDDGIATVEGEDPDGVVVTYPSPSGVRLSRLPGRVYRY